MYYFFSQKPKAVDLRVRKVNTEIIPVLTIFKSDKFSGDMNYFSFFYTIVKLEGGNKNKTRMNVKQGNGSGPFIFPYNKTALC